MREKAPLKRGQKHLLIAAFIAGIAASAWASAATPLPQKGRGGNSCLNFDIGGFVIKNFPKRPDLTPIKVSVLSKKQTGIPGWCSYRFEITFNQSGRVVKSVPTNLMINTEKGVGAFDLINLKTGGSIAESIFNKINKETEDDRHLVSGSPNALHKVVIFSDPICPYCKNTVPKILEFSRKNPKELAVYLYHFPLTGIHRQAKTVSAAMAAAENKMESSPENKSRIIQKIYESDLSGRQYSDPDVMAKFVSKISEGNVSVSKDDIVKAENGRVKADIEKANMMGVTQTPTFYFDEEKDENGRKTFRLIEKAKFIDALKKSEKQ